MAPGLVLPPNQNQSVNAPMVPAANVAARKMIYNVAVVLTVPDIKAAEMALGKLVKGCQGYVQRQTDNVFVLKIPAAAGEKMLAELAKLGRIGRVQRQAEDVSEAMVDLKNRIGNLEKLRTRLLALLDKATKVEDMLKIESELARITGELERLKGRERLMTNQVAYSTFTVTLVSALPQQQAQRLIPIAWVRALGAEITADNIYFGSPGSYRPFDYSFPTGFVVIGCRSSVMSTTAVSSEGLVLQAKVEAGLPGSQPEFWRKLIVRALTEINAYRIVNVTEVKVAGQLPCFRIEATKNIGGKDYTYMVAVMCGADGGELYLVECWGESAWFAPMRQAVDASLSTMCPWRWWQSAY